MGNTLQGLDPRLKNLIDKVLPSRLADEGETSVLVLAHGKLDEELLKKNGATHIVRLTEHIWSVRVGSNRLLDLKQLPEVVYIEAAKQLSPTLIRSVSTIKAGPEDVGGEVDGRDVVVGIIDYGIDWTLPDFCDETGACTRIKFLWDQSLTANEAERAPEDFDRGVEYTEKHINRALEALRQGSRAQALSMVRHRPWPERSDDATDTDGHGTHVTGIACGNGASGSAGCPSCRRPPSSTGYVGVAPRAWIVFVHLPRGRILGHIGKRDGSLGNSTELAEAIAYCYRKADALSAQLGKRVPCVVNLSMGFNGGSHDGESLVERVIDTMMEGRGRAMVVAAGNQRQQRTYFTATVERGTPYRLAWKMGLGEAADMTLNEMEIWYPSTCMLNVSLINPAGQRSESIEPGERKSFTLGDISGVIDSERFTTLNSDAQIYLRVSPGGRGKLEGRWTVELTAASGAPVPFDAWIEREAGPGFADEDPRQSKFDGQLLPPGRRATSLTVPATARRAIAVGAVSKRDTPELFQYSGTGPTRDGRLKPEIVAPGIDICSNDVRFDRGDAGICTQVQKTGTSMAAPHVAGVVALMFQVNPHLTAAQVRQILIASAARRPGDPDFDPQRGFGLLDARRAVQLVRETLS